MSSNAKKIWVIQSKNAKGTRSANGQTPRRDPRFRLGLAGESKARPLGQMDPDTRRSPGKSIPRWNPWLALPLTYLLGPLSILLRRNESPLWKATAMIVGVMAAAYAWLRPIDRLAGDPAVIQMFAAALAVAGTLTFITWIRALVLAGRDLYANPHSLPKFVYSSSMVGLLGFLVPGMGLLLAGHAKRAAAALVSVILVGGSALVLVDAPGLWARHLEIHGAGAANPMLETLFLGAAAAGLAGLLVWLIQALDGFRIAMTWRNYDSSDRGDVAAVALMAALAVMIFTVNSADVARDFDTLAGSSNEAGFRLVPFALAHTAMRLDPSRPTYVMRVADLYEELGKPDTASDLRQELRIRWLPYQEQFGVSPAPVAPEALNMVGSPAARIPFQPVDAVP